MNIASWLNRAGLSHPGLPAVGYSARVVQNYGGLAERAGRLANALHALDLKPGDRVAIIAKNCVEYVETIFGIWHGGFAAVPANAKLHGRELGYILEHSGARVCLATPGLGTEVAPHAPASLERLIVIGGREYDALFAAQPAPVTPRDGSDLAWLFYTSGTTGRPKGAMLTHRNLALARPARFGRAALCVRRSDGCGRRGSRAAGGRGGRNPLPRRRGDARLLAQSGRDRADPARRLAAHRRCRGIGYRRLPHFERPF